MSDVAQVVVVSPRRAGMRERLRELRQRRGLILFFGRDMLEKRYARTLLGLAWVPLRPVLDITMRLFLFGGVLGLGSEGVPYLLYLVFVLGAWQVFAGTAYWATRSMDFTRTIMKRVYVPRLAVLCGSAVVSGVDYIVYLCIGAIAVAGYAISDGQTYLAIGPETLLFPAGLLCLLLAALGIGLFTSVYATHVRDIRFGLTYLLGFWQFMTPVVYPLDKVPDSLHFVVYANPLTAPIEMVKRGVFGVGELHPELFISTAVFLVVVLVGGLLFFLQSENIAVDNL